MADLTPSQIASVGDGADLRDDSPRSKAAKRKETAKSAPNLPIVESDEKEETHQLDELA